LTGSGATFSVGDSGFGWFLGGFGLAMLQVV